MVGEILWEPPADVRESTVMGRFVSAVERKRGVSFPTYQDLHAWSIGHLDDFWQDVAEFSQVKFQTSATRAVDDLTMPGTRWFEGATLNYAEHCLAGGDDVSVLVCLSEVRERIELTRGELKAGVAHVRAGLLALGVGKGDCVASYLPSGAESVMAMLATASLGGVWTSCAPEFGSRNVLDKLVQVQPKVLLATDGYSYRGRRFDRRTDVAEIVAGLPELAATVLLPYLDLSSTLEGALLWEDVMSLDGPLEFEPVDFDHPLYVLYSSGTTGKPKAIVHSHGAIVLEHFKLMHIHDDIQEGDTYFWFSSTGWMAWNFNISALMCGAKAVMLDGDPMFPTLEHYWKVIGEEGVTFLGVSPAFLLACRKQGLVPREVADVSSLRTINSGGAPLPADGFRWIYDAVSPTVYLSSGSGGTDIASSFVGGSRLLPVTAGFIACRLLGVAAYAFDTEGHKLVDEQGELVITAPMPSMPSHFWGDDGSRLRSTYFDRFPGVWCHGDWVTFTEDGRCVVSGRSDATLNRGGVRIGTSEFYSAIEEIPEIADSLVVHLEDGEGGLGELLLFVVLQDGEELDDALGARIRDALRRHSSPRHTPDQIIQAATVPRTHSAKKMEVPVKRLLQGVDPREIMAQSSTLLPGSLDWYVQFSAERAGRAPSSASATRGL